ncbi:MAG: hypothetical protein J5634_00260 [Bacilli bacterium]|nr:hypothetical protein [Bacilli bacterium]
MSLEIFDKQIDQKLHAFITVSTYCMTYISVDEANKLGIEYTNEDVKCGVLKGVKFKYNSEEEDFLPPFLVDTIMSWKLLGFKDGEFVTERRFNSMYMDYVNNQSKGAQRNR